MFGCIVYNVFSVGLLARFGPLEDIALNILAHVPKSLLDPGPSFPEPDIYIRSKNLALNIRVWA